MTKSNARSNNNDKSSTERKSYRVHFFILSIVLSISFLWSIYDEAITRREWKSYQEEFFKLETGKLKKELVEAKKALASPEVKELEERLKKLTEELNRKEKTPEYRNLVRELDEKETALIEVSQELQFAKSLADEAYYEYQHAFDTGGDYLSKKNKWKRLYAIAKAWEPEVERAKKERDEVKKKLGSYGKEKKELQHKLEKYQKRILNINNKLQILSQKRPGIRQIVIHNFERNKFGESVLRVDRCLSCHMASDRKGFEKFPEPFKTHSNFPIIIQKHPVEKFGCTSCHDGQGSGLSFYDAGHTPRSRDQAERWRKGYDWKPISHWEKPMLQGDFIQASCRRCHFLEEDIPGAPVLSKGINLFREVLGCVNCHLVKGYEDVNKIGPDLSNVGSKVNPSWLFRWLKDPKWHHKKTRMPNFKLSDQEAISLTSFLMSLKGDKDWKVYELRDDILNNSTLIARGRRLVRDIGCSGCHTVGGAEVYKNKKRDIAPILTNIGNKASPVWVLNWILNPTGYSPNTLMPNLRLSLDDAEAIVAYLFSLADPNFEELKELNKKTADKIEIARGFKVVSDYGCYGCHEIPGTENLSRVGAELSNFGNKELSELAFGYAREVERSWLGYARAKLKTPRKFETEIVEQKMPDFGLSDDEAHALTVLLKSFRDEETSREFTRDMSPDYVVIQRGRKLIKKYNCIGCHEVEKGWEGQNILVPLREKYKKKRLVKSYAPPPLMGEGRKVQSEWLFKFLRQPFPIRPWLTIKMPTFNLTDEQVNSIVRYFQAISGENIFYHFWKKKDYSAEEKKEMKSLFDLLECIKCHRFGKGGEPVSVAKLGPELSLTKQRLKPKWVEDWLINPQGLQKGTKMPNFFFDIDEDGEVTELLPEPKKKIELLINYLYGME